MKNFFCFLLFGLISLNVSAQDAKAKAILDKVSAINKEHKSIKAEFTFSMDNEEEDIHEISDGSILLKENKYKLNLMGTDTYFDGKTQYVHIIDAEEVSIKEPDEDEDEALNPAKIFSIYENGFTYKYVNEVIENGKKLHVIDLFPTDKERGFTHIRLKIDQATSQISALKSVGKDGNDVSIVLKKLTPNVTLTDKDFIFDTAANPDVDVNDMR
ncbi:outer membrane lipoprotein carrier protein LolA [Marinifilum sp. D714]|uniref:LolA family protein n=1 Tax=Marinifilum sp. D714 TaxID=2937523 RepID=UPI0027C1AA9C|nr:outer membrane lipoprotein carrier protein LolA [Marinifilum sp. D714]MDQ2177223.1 outer membrane lipoprotein carrier protein LolA [Marinifilum sp. D714]